VTEAGASNFFVVWKTEAGEIELVTASIDDGLILDGVTRRSVLDAVRANQNVPSAWQHQGQQLAPLKASERNFSIHEIQKAAAEGRLIEAFAAGSAVRWQGGPGGVPCLHEALMSYCSILYHRLRRSNMAERQYIFQSPPPSPRRMRSSSRNGCPISCLASKMNLDGRRTSSRDWIQSEHRQLLYYSVKTLQHTEINENLNITYKNVDFIFCNSFIH